METACYGILLGMKTLTVTCSDPSDLKDLRKNGADEVILALQNNVFSALQEMNQDEILDCCGKAHEEGLKVLLLMNCLYPQSEIDEAAITMISLLENGVDSVIFADPGLLYFAMKKGLENRMIYQPETLITSSCDASFWMSQNISSAVLPSLITREEIAEIARKVKGLTLYVHGRLLMSVSRRKLLKAYKTKADVHFENEYNRSLTLVEEKRNGRMPVYENKNACMIFTDYVQESFDEMKDFRINIDRFVIDGSFLSKQECMDAAAIYRSILDGGQPDTDSYRKKYGKENLSDGYYGQKTVR